jgi:manganese efflux pump family protein
MSITELLLLSVGLAMDAVAVSICKGLSMNRLSLKNALIVGAWFGGFQALMPLAGYLLGTTFAGYIQAFSGWIAFILLLAIGINMIREALPKKNGKVGDDVDVDCSLGLKAMFLMAVATSIDALAVGVTFSFLHVRIIPAVLTIGVMTFFLSMVGVKIGSAFGKKFEAPAEIVGGLILCGLGIKILLEQLGIG